MFLNRHDVADLLQAYGDSDDLPNVREAAWTLARLVNWADSCSDGWPYWRAPINAARQLQALLAPWQHYPYPERDIGAAELRKACAPIRALLTRRGVDHGEVFR